MKNILKLSTKDLKHFIKNLNDDGIIIDDDNTYSIIDSKLIIENLFTTEKFENNYYLPENPIFNLYTNINLYVINELTNCDVSDTIILTNSEYKLEEWEIIDTLTSYNTNEIIITCNWCLYTFNGRDIIYKDDECNTTPKELPIINNDAKIKIYIKLKKED